MRGVAGDLVYYPTGLDVLRAMSRQPTMDDPRPEGVTRELKWQGAQVVPWVVFEKDFVSGRTERKDLKGACGEICLREAFPQADERGTTILGVLYVGLGAPDVELWLAADDITAVESYIRAGHFPRVRIAVGQSEALSQERNSDPVEWDASVSNRLPITGYRIETTLSATSDLVYNRKNEYWAAAAANSPVTQTDIEKVTEQLKRLNFSVGVIFWVVVAYAAARWIF